MSDLPPSVEIFSHTHDAFAELCKQRKQWGLLLSYPPLPEDVDGGPAPAGEYRRWADGIERMVPWLGKDKDGFQHKSIWEGGLWAFGPAEDIQALYGLVHGDDGPCGGEPDGSCSDAKFHVYALTCDSLGRFMNENT